MKVRLAITPHGYVKVEVKQYWFSAWEYVTAFQGDDAWQDAEKYALALKNPVTKEIK